jgi:hypothetical protein
MSNSGARRDHSATTGDPSAGMGIGERLLPSPVKVRPSRRQFGLVEGRLSAHQEVQRVRWLAGLSGEDGSSQDCVG